MIMTNDKLEKCLYAKWDERDLLYICKTAANMKITGGKCSEMQKNTILDMLPACFTFNIKITA